MINGGSSVERFIDGPEIKRKSNPKHPFAMKIWFNKFLENAAFPAIVLAFACSLINHEISDVRQDSSTADQRSRLAKTLTTYSDRLAAVDGARGRKGLP
jgi:hypothetical protein